MDKGHLKNSIKKFEFYLKYDPEFLEQLKEYDLEEEIKQILVWMKELDRRRKGKVKKLRNKKNKNGGKKCSKKIS